MWGYSKERVVKITSAKGGINVATKHQQVTVPLMPVADTLGFSKVWLDGTYEGKEYPMSILYEDTYAVPADDRAPATSAVSKKCAAVYKIGSEPDRFLAVLFTHFGDTAFAGEKRDGILGYDPTKDGRITVAPKQINRVDNLLYHMKECRFYAIEQVWIGGPFEIVGAYSISDSSKKLVFFCKLVTTCGRSYVRL